MRTSSVLGFGLVALTAAFITNGCSSTSARKATFETTADASAPTDPVEAGPMGPNFGTSSGGDEDDGGQQICSSTKVKFTVAPVFLEFVTDKSGSMDQDNKWDSLTGAMKEVFTQMYRDLDPTVGVGLILFPSASNESDPHSYPDRARDVFIQFVDATQLNKLTSRISGTADGGDTPTYPAMVGGYSVLQNLVPLAPLPPMGKKVLVLSTDGIPNGDGGKTKDDYKKLAQTNHDTNDILTFVIGIGRGSGEIDQNFLGTIAQAGGTGDPGCNVNEMTDPTKMCHFWINPGVRTASELKQDFIDAITKIRKAAAGCDYDINLDDPDDPSKHADPSNVSVNITVTDDMGNDTVNVIPNDDMNGWTFNDPEHPTKLTLHGDACTTATSRLRVKVDILLACKSHTN
jgi:hypothetical protein